MRYLVSLSGGAASAVAAEMVIERHGREQVDLWIADTSMEDPDLWRFVDDLEARWGGPVVRYRDGRTPWEVGEQKKLIPNNRMLPCTYVLKIEPFVKYLRANHAPGTATVVLGMGRWESARCEAPDGRYREMGYDTCYPLFWEGAPDSEWAVLTYVTTRMRIEIPEMYRQGFHHNNCGGMCFRQGMEGWLLLYEKRPDRYQAAEHWEALQRAKGGARADKSILKRSVGGVSRPVTLTELREAYVAGRAAVKNGRAQWAK